MGRATREANKLASSKFILIKLSQSMNFIDSFMNYIIVTISVGVQ